MLLRAAASSFKIIEKHCYPHSGAKYGSNDRTEPEKRKSYSCAHWRDTMIQKSIRFNQTRFNQTNRNQINRNQTIRGFNNKGGNRKFHFFILEFDNPSPKSSPKSSLIQATSLIQAIRVTQQSSQIFLITR